MGESGWQRVPVLDARLGDLPGESLGDFGGFGDAAPLCHQAWNVGARGEESAAGQSFDVESNRRFVHGCVFRAYPGRFVQHGTLDGSWNSTADGLFVATTRLASRPPRMLNDA